MKTPNLFIASTALTKIIKSLDKTALTNSARTTALSTSVNTNKTAEASHISDHLASAGKNVMQFTSAHVGPAAEQATRWVIGNPGTAAMYGAAGLGLVAVAAPGAIATPALAAVGFGAHGPVGGMSSPSTYIFRWSLSNNCLLILLPF
jgi:predicted aconitase